MKKLNKNLHIITINIPYPPDYGGMIDTYYRIKALHDLGIQIHLHCFEYGRHHSEILGSLCKKVTYYPRLTGLSRQISIMPYIVSSRSSMILLNNLSGDDYPILFDGIHSTRYITHPALSGRRRLVRLHNIEHKYYLDLAKNEKNLLKKIFYITESAKLRRYERVLDKADHILPVSIIDHMYFIDKYKNSCYLPPFHPFESIESLPGYGAYILYHGDLSVNQNAALSDSLISNVFSKITYNCIIAGKNPPASLKKHAGRYKNIKVISNPDINEMKVILKNAHLHIIPAITNNGFKLKLLMALFSGRHCLVNSTVSENVAAGSLCHVADSNEEITEKIRILMQEPFTEDIIENRKRVLTENFNNIVNAKKLIELIFL